MRNYLMRDDLRILWHIATPPSYGDWLITGGSASTFVGTDVIID